MLQCGLVIIRFYQDLDQLLARTHSILPIASNAWWLTDWSHCARHILSFSKRIRHQDASFQLVGTPCVVHAGM